MLNWLKELDSREKVNDKLVKTMSMEHDYKLHIVYDLELYRVGKTSLTTLRLFYQDTLVLESNVLHGKVLNANTYSFHIDTTNNYGENTLLGALENFNMILRYLVVETQNKGEK
jgi:hypothetical protein